MKTERIRSVRFDNRRRTIDVEYSAGKQVSVHYGQLGLKEKIAAVWVDEETGRRSIGIRFVDGTEDFMPYDQPLALARDPEYLLQNQIERVVARIQQVLAKKHISKRFLAVQLGTSDNQIQRLLNPSILNKNLEQLCRVGLLLGLEFEWRIKKAA